PNISARATSRWRISCPSGVFRFTVTLFTPRLFVSKYVLGIPGSTVEPRDVSPPSGTSILMTSAPRSAISMYGTVPAWAVEHATTLTPCKGPCGSVMSASLQQLDQWGNVRDSTENMDQAETRFHFPCVQAGAGNQPAVLGIHVAPRDAECGSSLRHKHRVRYRAAIMRADGHRRALAISRIGWHFADANAIDQTVDRRIGDLLGACVLP